MLYLLFSSGFSTNEPGNSPDNRIPLTVPCPIGQCATNLFTGYKICPGSTGTAYINPEQEVCNSQFVCDNPITPYAVNADGSTNLYGVCEPGVACPCLRVLQCPEYIISAFTTSNGNPYEPLEGQRITFPQISSYTDVSGVESTTPPIQYTNPATIFCAAPLSWMPFSTPGCNFIDVGNNNDISYDDVLLCMGMISGCSGITGSPCLQGTLAFLSRDPGSLTQGDIYTTQLACVQGEPCPCGFVAIYDTNYGGIVCRQLETS